MIKEAEFKSWSEGIRASYEQAFGERPNATPNLVYLTSPVQERMMRCAIEAHYFGIQDNRDELAILAHHTLLKDDLKSKSDLHLNYLEDLYGFQEKQGLLDTVAG